MQSIVATLNKGDLNLTHGNKMNIKNGPCKVINDRRSSFNFRFLSRFIIAYFLLQISTVVVAQTDTTAIDSSQLTTAFDNSLARVEYFIGDSIDYFRAPDTTLNRFQKFNPARQQAFEYAYLGNLGSPYYPRFFSYDRNIGFDYGRHERDLYLFDIKELRYFRCNVPYTDLYYVIGSHNEQLFHGTYARNFGRDLNISFDFQKIASDGFYQHMKNDYNNISLTGWYKNKKGNYSAYAGGIYNRHKNDENGGINNDTLFESPNPEFQLPFRSLAFTLWKSWQGQLTQQILIGKTKEYVINDSTTGKYFVPAIALKHTFGAEHYSYLFEDAEFDKTFYGFIYVNDDTLRDQSAVEGFYNRLSVSNTHYKTITVDSLEERDMDWEIYGLQQYHIISDQGGQRIVRNLITGINAQKYFLGDSVFRVIATGAYDVIAGTYDIEGNIKLIQFNIQPEAGFKFAAYDPTEIQNNYFGFNNQWNNNFEQIQYTKLFFGLHFPQWKMDAEYSAINFKNYIYYTGEFNQADNTSLSQISLHKEFTLGNFHLDNYAAVQKLNSGFFSFQKILAPDLLANISWYYQSRIFKNALFYQIGFDAWWCSDYQGYVYDFVNGQWAINSVFIDPNQDLSFSPVIDVFANFDIRTFRFFVKVDNVAQGLFSKGYFEAPFYPMQPRGFKFGVNWMLYY
ncbi:MAG: putative porin [Chitinophagales bacterium]